MHSSMHRFVRAVLGLALVAISLGSAHATVTSQTSPSQSTLSFALIGDQPYNDTLEAATDTLLSALAQTPAVQWILHVGDIKGGGEPCSNELLNRRIAQMERSEKPLVYVVGDNEWTDCHRDSNGNYNSEERLDFLRSRAHQPPHSLGKTKLSVQRQVELGFPEHQMWQMGSTLFVVLNVPGSNNHLSNPSSRKASGERVKQLFLTREQAIDQWLTRAEEMFSRVANAPTETVIAIQGNPIDGSGKAWRFENLFITGDGYERFNQRLVSYMKTTARPLLLVHGDTHRFKWDQPSLAEYGATPDIDDLFYRVEGWGHPFVNNWVKVTVNQGSDKPFHAESIGLPIGGNN